MCSTGLRPVKNKTTRPAAPGKAFDLMGRGGGPIRSVSNQRRAHIAIQTDESESRRDEFNLDLIVIATSAGWKQGQFAAFINAHPSMSAQVT